MARPPPAPIAAPIAAIRNIRHTAAPSWLLLRFAQDAGERAERGGASDRADDQSVFERIALIEPLLTSARLT
jgi:hypothetical protein